jgi:hypothetical protein
MRTAENMQEAIDDAAKAGSIVAGIPTTANYLVLSIQSKAPGFTGSVKEELLGDLPKIVRASFDRLDKGTLKKWAKVRSEASKFLEENSLPTGIKSLRLTPLARVPRVNQKMKEFKREMMRYAKDFISEYPSLVLQFSYDYPDYYDPEKYPTQEELADRFEFNWVWFKWDFPETTGAAELMTAEELDEERGIFINNVRRMQTEVLEVLAKGLQERLLALPAMFDKRKEEGQLSLLTNGCMKSIAQFLNKMYSGLYDQFLFDKELKDLVENKIRPFIDNPDNKIKLGGFDKDSLTFQADAANVAEELSEKLTEIVNASKSTKRSLDF